MTDSPMVAAQKTVRTLTGIDSGTEYPSGLVTLTVVENAVTHTQKDTDSRDLILVAWKIDDLPWKLHTTGQWKISPNDTEARKGVTAFVSTTTDWCWGIAPFMGHEMDRAILLRDRILRLTAEFGLTLASEEATVVRGGDE